MADVKEKPSPLAGIFKLKEAKRFEHDRELVAARFSPCGKFLFAGSYDGHLYRWDVVYSECDRRRACCAGRQPVKADAFYFPQAIPQLCD